MLLISNLLIFSIKVLLLRKKEHRKSRRKTKTKCFVCHCIRNSKRYPNMDEFGQKFKCWRYFRGLKSTKTRNTSIHHLRLRPLTRLCPLINLITALINGVLVRVAKEQWEHLINQPSHQTTVRFLKHLFFLTFLTKFCFLFTIYFTN